MRIALDTAGGDSRQACIDGALIALRRQPTLELALVALTADETDIRERLRGERSDVSDRVTLTLASEAVPKDIPDDFLMSVRRNKETTMHRAFSLVEGGQADGVVTSGNTAGLVMLSGMLGRLKRTQKALMATLPTTSGRDIAYLDAGANPNTTVDGLIQNFRWGAFYAETLFERTNPQGAFLNIGIERGKGHEDLLAAHEEIAKKHLDLRLAGAGNAEPDHVFQGLIESPDSDLSHSIDFVATDGYSGNIGLKTLKAAAKALLKFLKQRLQAKSPFSPVRRVQELGALTLKPILVSIMDEYQEKVGGGTLMGVDGLVTKVHGSSKPNHVAGGIERTHKLLQHGFLEKLRRFHGN